MAACAGCTKLVQVPQPQNTITTEETFSTDASATAAIVGIYNDMLTGNAGSGYNLSYGNGLTTIDCGMSADELLPFGGVSPFQTMVLNSSTSDINYAFWPGPYYDIYLANATIEGLQNSSGVSPSGRAQLTGEAKFLRAFCYFYLVNWFGAVPLVTTTAYATTDTLSRSAVATVYLQIISDLKDAQNLLADDYSVSGGQRIRVNKYGAAALLARAYLYTLDYPDAEAAATTVINASGLYTLESNLNNVFLDTSSEAILQLATYNSYPYATEEANSILPSYPGGSPNYYLTSQLVASFEPRDQRYPSWIDSTNVSGTEYYFPNKYNVYASSGAITENYVLLRLAEQYLIRAEARAEQNNLSGAISDLDVIRQRAGLDSLSSSLNQAGVLAAVMQERKIELFCEWGHRWLDLKRTGQAIAILSSDKGITVTPDDLLYPIPASELTNDGSLVQNPGY